MRQGQQGKRMRGRGGRKGGSNPANRTYESNGPDVKVRGTAAHIAEKYVQLARDAASAGDPVASENYLQHAEHYFRIVAASQPAEQRVPFAQNNDNDGEDENEEAGGHNGGHVNGHMAGRGEQPSELAAPSGEPAEEAERAPAAAEPVEETPAPRRGRGRPRRQQDAQKNGAAAHGESGDATDAPVVRNGEQPSEAPLEA